MESGFYKQEGDEWFYGPNKVIGPFESWELTKETKDQFTYPYQGWTWYDSAPQGYIDWLIEIGVLSTQSGTQSFI